MGLEFASNTKIRYARRLSCQMHKFITSYALKLSKDHVANCSLYRPVPGNFKTREDVDRRKIIQKNKSLLVKDVIRLSKFITNSKLCGYCSSQSRGPTWPGLLKYVTYVSFGELLPSIGDSFITEIQPMPYAHASRLRLL